VATDWAARLDLLLWFVNVRRPVRPVPDLIAPAGRAAVATGDIGESDLVALARRHQRPGLEPNWDALHGHDPARAIVELAAARPGSLLVLGTHSRTGLSHAVLGSVAQRVVHDSPAPVLVVRGASFPGA
jgi:nucleotide-binding universal stress UspA family protein